jgi:hypothetical protein
MKPSAAAATYSKPMLLLLMQHPQLPLLVTGCMHTLFAITSAVSVRLMRERSFSADFDILAVPSCVKGNQQKHGTSTTSSAHKALNPGLKQGRERPSQHSIIHRAPTWSDMMRAPAGGMKGSGTLNTRPPRPPRFFHCLPPYRLLTLSAMSRVSSRCCFWSSPTGTRSAWA